MKMVKSLLLGTAAGLVAMTGAQAADLPVKAKPVQYVKICSLYGAGFYYIPGTDMCLKMGGWVRAEAGWGMNGSSTTTEIADLNNRGTNNQWWRVRGYITADARNQTEYGTVRSYIAVGVNTNEVADENQTFNANKAFIQFAGFTFGRATSFYDFFSGSFNSYMGWYPQSDTGDGGKDVMAYTAQFGNGLSASLSAELRRTTQIVGQQVGVTTSNGALGSVVTGAQGYGGWQVPDIVANLRIDQAWGSAQIMGALHEVNTTYYINAPAGFAVPEGSGHPEDKWGFVIGAGAKFMVPAIGPGDYLWGQVNYTQGALRYLFQNPNGNWFIGNGNAAAYTVMSDGVYGGTLAGGNTTDVNLTTAWGFNLAYEHFWSKQWRTSLHGGYYAVSYNDQANSILCVLQGNGAGTGSLAVAAPGCDNNWNTWWIGSRTQFNLDASTYLGLDVAYQAIQSATTSTGFVPAVSIPAGTANVGRTVSDEHNWSARFRVHRDFYP